MFKKPVQQLVAIHDFLHKIEKLKMLLRHSWLSDGRQESVAEHTWRMAMMAMLLAPHVEHKLDVNKVIKMVLVHDVAEIIAGDYVAFKHRPDNKHELEQTALVELTKELEKELQEEFLALWLEFEECVTFEAKFAQALDKIEVLIQHNEADISTWEEKEYEFNYYYGYDKVQFSKVLTLFRDLVLEETHQKVLEEVQKDAKRH